MNTKTNLSQHPCENKCSKFNGEQCSTCLIQEVEKREFDLGLAPDADYVKNQIAEGDFIVFTNHIRDEDVYQIDAFQPAEYFGDMDFEYPYTLKPSGKRVLRTQLEEAIERIQLNTGGES
ncbi:hypothetical protein [Acinetobacter calcoaceticus]|uniref:hypothetical protein n=1 Tax=Acinetobacter calcoaceticus TaxID=471 RepID=UPI0018DD1401|nr:hypothetical protein [Acinetobacter calcoaceticus]